MKLPLPQQRPVDAGEAFAQLCAKDHLNTDDLIMLALLEASGQSLYGAIADLSDSLEIDNREIKALLNQNGQEELGHAHRILKALSILTGNQYELPEDEHNPMVGAWPAQEFSAELMESFIQAELDGEAHYNRWAENETNKDVVKIYRLIGADERRHSERDKRVLEILQGHQY